MKKWQHILDKCLEQNKFFRSWDKNKKYDMFHHSHYDWWAFPIDQPSSQGTKYQIGKNQKEILIQKPQFVEALRSNAVLVCRAWGYDLEGGKDCVERTKDQIWHYWPIRLFKMTNSLQLFEQKDLFVNAVKYGNILIKKGQNFVYSRRDLSEYFIEKGKVIELS